MDVQAGKRDFAFDSMSFEDSGAVTIARGESGWVFGSRFTPEIASSAVAWLEVKACVAAFGAKVRVDLAVRDIELDWPLPDWAG